MDDANLQGQVAQHGPQLIHWVASVPNGLISVMPQACSTSTP